MKITPYLNRCAPELCYFTINNARFTEKPMLGKNVDWYNVMHRKNADHPITAIRKKHFQKCYFAKVAKIEICFPAGYEWLDETKRTVFKNGYADLLKQIKGYMTKKHPSYYDHNMKLYNGDTMPIPTLKITTSTQYVKAI